MFLWQSKHSDSKEPWGSFFLYWKVISLRYSLVRFLFFLLCFFPMQLFKNTTWKLSEINEKSFDLEKDLQKLTEENLSLIFWLKFVASEFSLHEFRIDTLAYDEENKSFAIIEYKRGSSFSVVDQWYSYLSLMLNNQADFVLEINQKLKKNFTKKDINREGSKAIFVANSFTPYQKNAINFKDLPIELWEAKKFGADIVVYDQIKAKNTQASVKTITKNTEIDKVVKELKTYTVEDHFKEDWSESKELYEELREKLLALDGRLEEFPTKIYIGFNIGRNNVAVVKIHKSKLWFEPLRVRPEDMNDPEKKLTYVENSMKFWNKHVSKMDITNSEDIDYAVLLMKQLLKKFFN